MLFWVIFVFDLFLYLCAPNQMEKGYMSAILIMAAFSICVFVSRRKIIEKKSKIQAPIHSMFFIVCFCIVFFQYALDYVLGFVDDTDHYVWVNPSVVTKSLAISNLALICLIIGYNNNNKRILQHSNKRKYNIDCSKKTYLAHIVSCLLLLYFLLVPKEYLNYGYGQGLEAGSVNAITSYLVAGFLAMIVIYSVDYNSNKKQKWFKEFRYPIILVALYVALILSTGRRGDAIRIVSLLVISYIYCNRGRIKYLKLVLIGLCMLSVFSILGAIRSLQRGNINEGFKIISEYKSISPFTREIASSVNTLHVATTYFPDVHDYDYGTTFIPSFFKIIPGFSSLYEYLILNEPMKSSGDIITDLYFFGDPVWGLGSSMIADIYISYSTIGVCIIFLIFGYFIRTLEYYASGIPISPYLLALSFNAFASFLIACRGSISIIFLFWGYSCLIIFFFTKKSSKKDYRYLLK